MMAPVERPRFSIPRGAGDRLSKLSKVAAWTSLVVEELPVAEREEAGKAPVVEKIIPQRMTRLILVQSRRSISGVRSFMLRFCLNTSGIFLGGGV
jgi:hypothetical protein